MPDAQKTATLYGLVLLSLVIIVGILYVSSRAFLPKIVVNRVTEPEQIEAVSQALSSLNMDEDQAISLVREIKASQVKDALKALEGQQGLNPQQKLDTLIVALLKSHVKPEALSEIRELNSRNPNSEQFLNMIEKNKGKLNILLPYYKSSMIEVLKKSKEQHDEK